MLVIFTNIPAQQSKSRLWYYTITLWITIFTSSYSWTKTNSHSSSRHAGNVNLSVCQLDILKTPFWYIYAHYNILLRKGLAGVCDTSYEKYLQIHIQISSCEIAEASQSPPTPISLSRLLQTDGVILHIMMISFNRTFNALLALCAGNLPITGEFPSQGLVTRSFEVFFDLRLE